MADYEDTKVSNLIINNMSQEKFDELAAAGELDPTQVYLTPTEAEGGASLPDQTGNEGKFLTTDGENASWSDKPLVNQNPNGGIAIGWDQTIASATKGISIGYNVTINDLNYAGRTISIGNYTTAQGASVAIGHYATATGSSCVVIGHLASAPGSNNIAIGTSAKIPKVISYAIQLGSGDNNDANTFKVGNQNGNFELMDENGNVPRERLKNLVEVLPTADNGYTTVKNFGNGYVEITGYASIGTVGAGTGSEIQVDLPAGYTMADANYWVNIAPTSETTMFDLKAEAKARSTTHFMVAYKNEDAVTGLTNAGVYWEIRGMLATE